MLTMVRPLLEMLSLKSRLTAFLELGSRSDKTNSVSWGGAVGLVTVDDGVLIRVNQGRSAGGTARDCTCFMAVPTVLPSIYPIS